MQRIYPPRTARAGLDADELRELYAYPDVAASRPWVRANMISSIDGAAQGPDGRSGSLSTPADSAVLGLLRALADVVVAGAGTVRTERYGAILPRPEVVEQRRGRGQPPVAPIAVVTRSLALDPGSSLFSGADQRTIVVTVEAAPADRRAELERVADVVVAGETDVDVRAMVAALAERGLTRILCEGGPGLLAQLVAAEAVDELCYTLSPVIVGGHALRLLDGDPLGPVRWNLGHIVEDDGALMTRWTVAR